MLTFYMNWCCRLFQMLFVIGPPNVRVPISFNGNDVCIRFGSSRLPFSALLTSHYYLIWRDWFTVKKKTIATFLPQFNCPVKLLKNWRTTQWHILSWRIFNWPPKTAIRIWVINVLAMLLEDDILLMPMYQTHSDPIWRLCCR